MRVELHLGVDWGVTIPAVGRDVQRRVARYLEQMAERRPDASTSSSTRSDRREPGRVLAGLTGVTLETAPRVCHDCVWWQSRGDRHRRQGRWIEKAEDGVGRVGDALLRRRRPVLGSMQYGPGGLFPRAAELPAGPPSDDAVLVTCAYLVETVEPVGEQSLFLAAIGEARDRGAKALEAFAYRYREGESQYERFLVHRTVFPRDFLADFGFQTVRAHGPRRAGAARARRPRAGRGGHARKVLRVVKEAFVPAPAPVPPGP